MKLEKGKMLSKKWGYLLFSLIGFGFCFFSVTGYQLAEKGNILWTGKYTAIVLGGSLAAGILGGCALCKLFYLVGEGKLSFERKGFGEKDVYKTKSRAGSLTRLSSWMTQRLPGAGGCFLLSWALTVCAWLPGFLAYYPAICSYDTPVQMGQILSGEYIDHHPLVHTLLLRESLRLGERFLGGPTAGIGLFAFLQMAALAAVFAVGIAILRKRRAGGVWLALLLVYGMFFPFHMYMSISTTKDPLFTIFTLLALFAMYELTGRTDRGWKPGGWDVLLAVAALGMVVFRNNGKYALLVLLVSAAAGAVFGRRGRRGYIRILAGSAAGLLAGSLLLAGVFRLLDAQPGDKREMLSLPIQQLARTMIYHGGAGVLPGDDNTMEEEDKALINDFILNQAYTQYRPDISDPVKKNTNTYVVRYRLKEFAGTYFHLLARYPGDFINAALAVNAGYLYPGDITHATINVSPSLHGMGYIQTHWSEEELAAAGVHKASKWPWLYDRLEAFADSNAYLSVPVLKYLFAPGTYLWFYLVLAGWLALRRRFELLLPLALILGYYLTLFLGPTVQLRYLYPVMAALPFILARCVTRREAKALPVTETSAEPIRKLLF